MKYIPFKQFGPFSFTSSFEEIKDIGSEFKKIHIGERVELDKRYPSIYVYDLKTHIVFSEDASKIRCINTEYDVILEGYNLQLKSFVEIKKYFEKYDAKILVDEEGDIVSKKLGFTVSRESEKDINSILLVSRAYQEEEEITVEDIMKYYSNE